MVQFVYFFVDIEFVYFLFFGAESDVVLDDRVGAFTDSSFGDSIFEEGSYYIVEDGGPVPGKEDVRSLADRVYFFPFEVCFVRGFLIYIS